MTTKPEWERLAEALEFFWGPYQGPEEPNEMNAAAEPEPPSRLGIALVMVVMLAAWVGVYLMVM